MRTFANIGKESGKVVPTWSEFNAAAAVVLISWMVWIVAASAYPAPSSIEWMTSVVWPTSQSMAIVWVTLFTLVMFTRANSTLLKGTCRYGSESTAGAVAEPRYFTVDVFTNWSNCYQSTRTLLRDIYGLGHRTAPTVRVSSGGVAL